MRIVFLDVDGELTYSEYENEETANIDINKVLMLKELCDRADAKVVISSSWRGNETHTPRIYHILRKILAENEIEVIDDTPYVRTATERKKGICAIKYETGRAEEIRQWLARHPDVENFVILDDEDWGWSQYGYEKNWVQPSWHGNGGLKREHVEQAVRILLYNSFPLQQQENMKQKGGTGK